MRLFLLALLFFFTPAHAANSWRVAIVHEVVDVGHYRLRDGRLIQPLGVDVIQSFPWTDQKACHSREAFQMLKSALENSKIKIYSEKDSLSGAYRLKIDEIEINTWLLAHGFGKIQKNHSLHHSVLKKYKAAEREALLASRGLWSHCGNMPTLLKLKTQHARSASRLWDPIAVTRIKKIHPGPLLETQGGIQIKLLGITTPENSCLQNLTQKFLQKWLVGRNVFLYRDVSDFNEDGHLLRYAFLPPQNKNEPEFFINQVLIDQGLAYASQSSLDQKRTHKLHQAWKNQIKNLQGG